MSRILRSVLSFTVAAAIASVGITAVQLTSAPTRAAAIGNGVAETPPMAWDGWNDYVARGIQANCDNIGGVSNDYFNDAYFRALADSIVSSGMRTAGYNTIILTCGPEYRDANGYLQPRPSKFSSSNGIHDLFTYFHSLGLKGEVYTDGGQGSCLVGGIGSYDHMTQDAQTWASWGADAVKIDWCGGSNEGRDPSTVYPRYRDAIAAATAATGRPMWIEACEFGLDESYKWGASTINFWRTEQDIQNNWAGMLKNLDSNQHPDASGPGHYNFPDMLLSGVPGLTLTEQQSQFSMWAVMSSPLIVAFDPATVSTSVKNIVTNSEVIAVDQDALGLQGRKVQDDGTGQVYVKRLSDGAGSRAVAFLNRGNSTITMSVDQSLLGLTGGTATVRDLQAQSNLASSNGTVTVTLAAHASALLKIVGTDSASTIYDDTSSAWGYGNGTWGSTATSCDGRYNCSSHWSNQTGATATLTFTGGRAEVKMVRGNAGGIAAISVDGGAEILFDTYYPSAQSDSLIAEFGSLGGGQHTLTIRATGDKVGASSGTYVNIDRVNVSVSPVSLSTVDDVASGWSYGTGTWGSTTSSCDGRYACSSHWSNQTGATATLTFSGTQAELRLIKGAAGGIVGVKVDGGAETLYDTYSASTQNDASVTTLTGLSAGSHTVVLRVTGTKNASSTDTYVNVDRAITG